MGEGLKTLQESSVCHYFVDVEGTRVGGPMLLKDDALGLASSGD